MRCAGAPNSPRATETCRSVAVGEGGGNRWSISSSLPYALAEPSLALPLLREGLISAGSTVIIGHLVQQRRRKRCRQQVEHVAVSPVPLGHVRDQQLLDSVE